MKSWWLSNHPIQNSLMHTTHISHAHSAFEMTEDGPASKGSDQASEGHPREGRHRLLNLIDPSWQCLSLKPELIVNHIKPGNQDGKKDHPGLACLIALFCCQMHVVCKSEWPKSFSFVLSCFGFCFFWRCSPMTTRTSTISSPMVQWVRQVVKMCSKWRTRSVPSRALLEKQLMLGWHWHERIAFHGRDLSRLNSRDFHLFPRSVHNASADEIEINGLSIMGRIMWHFLSCLSRFNLYNFHLSLFPLSVHNAGMIFLRESIKVGAKGW